ncbi:MbtH family protein [Vibrio sp.]|uniref:MbtH family protein n=1 Tax=Vibrio viridaestus TaxID=2487322 RepID=A0A3N9TBD4_9VIBR|nr:MbtH family protein [Vibrio viridaestus]MDC0611225.1 MbtH family protein [Vibrio sp.]RQW61488.1 MbtH family protein [Vibrio viridaestus]
MKDQYINPFDDERYQFFVLVNIKNQHSLWPDFRPIPAGWTVSFGPAPKVECSDYIEKNWLDIRA